MKKVCNRNMLFAAILCLQLNVVAAFGQTVVKGSVKDNTGLVVGISPYTSNINVAFGFFPTGSCYIQHGTHSGLCQCDVFRR